MKHFAAPSFWLHYHQFPKEVQSLADKNFALLKADTRHASLHFKKAKTVWTVRVGSHYRAMAYDQDEGLPWFWIGPHSEYDQRV